MKSREPLRVLLSLSLLAAVACHREGIAIAAPNGKDAKATKAAPAAAAASPAKAPSSPPSAPAAAPVDPSRLIPRCREINTEMMPAGKFRSKRGNEVTLASFCLDRSEVTVAAYQACVDAGKCTEPDTEAGESCNWKASGDPASVKRNVHPINCVDQAQAAAYCAARGGRLPTADEFEWAQRGGAAARPFPWGDDELPRRVCSRANKNPDYPRAPVTCPVGSCPAGISPQQIHDLSGNVAEWTASPPPAKPGQKPSDERLVCGGQTSCQAGSINRVEKALGAGSCLAQSATSKFEGVGFRCARSL